MMTEEQLRTEGEVFFKKAFANRARFGYKDEPAMLMDMSRIARSVPDILFVGAPDDVYDNITSFTPNGDILTTEGIQAPWRVIRPVEPVEPVEDKPRMRKDLQRGPKLKQQSPKLKQQEPKPKKVGFLLAIGGDPFLMRQFRERLLNCMKEMQLQLQFLADLKKQRSFSERFETLSSQTSEMKQKKPSWWLPEFDATQPKRLKEQFDGRMHFAIQQHMLLQAEAWAVPHEVYVAEESKEDEKDAFG